MTKVEKISVALTPQLAEAVRVAVDAGDYATNSEVIREALRLWQARRDRQAAQVEELRRLIQEGLDSGPPRERMSFEEHRAELHRRLAERNGA